MADAAIDSKERLAAVTEKLNKIEAERAWNMSKEGKEANKRLKELQLRIKKENELLDKQAKDTDKLEDIEAKRADQAAELARLDASIAFARTRDAAKDRKADRKFAKDEAKRQNKLQNAQRDFGKEFYDSIFGTYSLIGSLKNMFPKPVQILAGWGFDKIKKGVTQGVGKLGKAMKGGMAAMFGSKPDADAPPEVKAAAAEVAPAEAAVPKKKLPALNASAFLLGQRKTDAEIMGGDGGAGGAGGAGGDGGVAAAEGAGIASPVIAMDSVAGSSAEQLEEMKKQTSLLSIIADQGEGEDASKSGEASLESGDKGGGKGGGRFGKLGKMLRPLFKAFKAIWKMVKVFLKWKTVVVVAILALVGWLTVKFWEPIKKAFLAVVDWFKGLWAWASDAISGAWTGLTEFIQGVWDGVVGWFKGLWAWGAKTGATIAKTWTGVVDWIKGVWDSVIGWFKGLWTWASEGIATGWTNVTTFVNGVWDKAISWFKGLWTWASEGISKGWTNVTTFVKGVWDKAIGWFKGLWTWGSEGIAKGWTNLTTYVSDIWTSVKKWFTGLFSWGDEDEKNVDEPEKGWLSTIFDKIFPEWITSPVTWVKKKLGLVDAEGKLTDKGAGVVEAGEGGIAASIQAIFADIFPDWLLHPVKWIKTKLGMLDAEGKKTDPAALVESGEGGIGAMIGALFNNIFPEWIRSPITWIKKKLGLVDDEGKLTDKAKDVVDASKGGIGAMISALFGDIFPEWITSPIQWIKKKLGIGAEKTDDTGGWEFPGFPTIADLKEFLPEWLTDPIGWVKGFFSDDPITDSAITEATSEHGQTLKAAKEANLYDEDAIGASEINREALAAGVKSGAVQQEMLQAIIDDKDLRDEDLQFMEQLVKQATTPGSLYVHDIELANILRKGFGMSSGDANVIPNNQLTPGNDIAAASSNMFGGGAGDTNNVITNAPVTNSNSSTVINVQTPKMASDPNTQKQSGYALSGWAKFD